LLCSDKNLWNKYCAQPDNRYVEVMETWSCDAYKYMLHIRLTVYVSILKLGECNIVTGRIVNLYISYE